MVYPETFTGFAIKDHKNWSKVEKIEFTPKPFEDYDVDIKIHACGVCGSDVHVVTDGWGSTNFPVIPGHEIIGEVVRVGPKVTKAEVGMRVGVGAQIWACLKCDLCKEDNEVYCPHLVDTYNCRYEDGSMAWGGYSSHIRAHEYFTFPIPDKLETEAAAPMLCAGITTYSPLVRNGAGPGKKVGIVGIGGLGHFGIMWAKALGAEVYVFSRTNSKKEDAYKLGADHFFATQEKDWNKSIRNKLDFIVSTANSSESFDLTEYLKTLKVGGKFISVGLPEKPFTVSPMAFISNASSLSSSHLGNRQEVLDMLQLAVDKNIRTWHTTIPIGEDGVKEALEGCHKNAIKYRYTLTDYQKAFD